MKNRPWKLGGRQSLAAAAPIDFAKATLVKKDGRPPEKDSTVSQSGGQTTDLGKPAENPERAVVKEQKLDLKVGEPTDELKMLTQRWKEITEKVGKIAVATRSVLPDVRPARVEKDRVVLAFDPEFADESERFNDVRMRRALEHVLGVILKRDVSVDIIVAAVEQAPVDAKGESAAPVHAAAKGKNGRTRQDLLNDPAVQKALDVFGGTVVDVRE